MLSWQGKELTNTITLFGDRFSKDAVKDLQITQHVGILLRREDLKESPGNRAETGVMWHTHQPRICQEPLRPEEAEAAFPGACERSHMPRLPAHASILDYIVSFQKSAIPQLLPRMSAL